MATSNGRHAPAPAPAPAPGARNGADPTAARNAGASDHGSGHGDHERTWTPNQAAKREALLDAAVEVLRTRGVAACTARAIADASPLTKSALHYYFSDVDEIVDVAFRRLIEAYLARIEKAAAHADDPAAALWGAAAAYLRLGSDRVDERGGRPSGDRPRRAPMLWFDYQVASARRGDTSTADELTERTLALFTQLVAATGVDHPAERAQVLFSALVGTVVRTAMRPRAVDAVLDELALVAGLPRTAG